jgi:hypothetical protein
VAGPICGEAKFPAKQVSGAANFAARPSRSAEARFVVFITLPLIPQDEQNLKRLAIAAPSPYARVIIGFGSAADA